MLICYVDESGCTGSLPIATSAIQPAIVISAVVFNHASMPSLTRQFIELKRRFYPSILPSTGRKLLSHILFEVKGAELRRKSVSGSHRERRHAIGFLDRVMDLLENHGAILFGRIWIKAIGQPFDGRAVYTFSIQDICRTFQDLLEVTAQEGILIADSRTKSTNASVSFSIFTQKYKSGGDEYARLIEMPTFGHSENHAGIQIADLLCSALMFPMATWVYCTGYVSSIHVRPEYALLRNRYGPRLKALQHRYMDNTTQRWRGGLTVSDALGQRSSAPLFS